jgi:hypothetical protein
MLIVSDAVGFRSLGLGYRNDRVGTKLDRRVSQVIPDGNNNTSYRAGMQRTDELEIGSGG